MILCQFGMIKDILLLPLKKIPERLISKVFFIVHCLILCHSDQEIFLYSPVPIMGECMLYEKESSYFIKYISQKCVTTVIRKVFLQSFCLFLLH